MFVCLGEKNVKSFLKSGESLLTAGYMNDFGALKEEFNINTDTKTN